MDLKNYKKVRLHKENSLKKSLRATLYTSKQVVTNILEKIL